MNGKYPVFANVLPSGRLRDGTILPDKLVHNPDNIDPGSNSKSFAAWKERIRNEKKRRLEEEISELVEELEGYITPCYSDHEG